MKTKKYIFHLPFYIEKDRHSGSHIRPLKMLKSFEELGYEVDIVMGYGKERKKQINKIMENIHNGIKYDFLYSESSTMPTLLTEKNHFPLYPFLDFNFFHFCKKNKIPIGLFYRDIYWKFPQYDKEISLIKGKISKIFYGYDLKKYAEVLDILYLPSLEMYPFLQREYSFVIKALPPGAQKITEKRPPIINQHSVKNENFLNIFYVGGIDKENYNLELILKAVSNVENIYLTLCTRKKEWENIKKEYEKYLHPRIKIIHEAGENLIPYYQEADILNLYLDPILYRSFAMPVKLFEYLSYKKPILGVNNTAVGSFIKDNDIGWTIDYDENVITKFLIETRDNKQELIKKRRNIEEILYNHTWLSRAKQVEDDLTSLRIKGI